MTMLKFTPSSAAVVEAATDLERLLPHLDLEEQFIVLGHLEGRTPEQLGCSEYTLRRLIHKMATHTSAERECPVCEKAVAASGYGWDAWNPSEQMKGSRPCLSCESTNQRHYRYGTEDYDDTVRGRDKRKRRRREPSDERPGEHRAKCEPRHGTVYCYLKHKCRCEPCREAKAADKQKRRTPIPRREAKHGTRYRYMKYGCRCEPCRMAAAEVRARQKRARAERPRPERPQTTRPKQLGRPWRPDLLRPCGTVASYRRGCKCDPCRAANAAHVRAHREKKRHAA